MTKNEALRILATLGYRLERNGKKHQYYTNGVRRVTLSHGLKLSPETIQQLRLLEKRELRAKQA